METWSRKGLLWSRESHKSWKGSAPIPLLLPGLGSEQSKNHRGDYEVGTTEERTLVSAAEWEKGQVPDWPRRGEGCPGAGAGPWRWWEEAGCLRPGPPQLSLQICLEREQLCRVRELSRLALS